MVEQILHGSRPPKVTKVTGQTKAQKADDSIMGTNNSSIVSKRSVERLYFANEPHFFRYFVKKPQRRSPLINRGYWLRMKAIDHVVRQFLEQKSEKQKLVINLGCGYDPLPWQCMARYPESCQNVKFIDIDYKDLMLRKQMVVRNTPELNSMLGNLTTGEGDILLSSDQYLQLGCDLRDLKLLESTLSGVVDINNCLVLLTAEVSITYMKTEAADALIRWASKLPNARFCLLEQLLPDGHEHPFAKTMMAHFDKLGTPLGAVQQYPTVLAQNNRFRSLGWPSVSVRNLWELWAAEDFLSADERMSLDFIEPFDEWEEFALFGSHYFLLVADTVDIAIFDSIQDNLSAKSSCFESAPIPSMYSEYPKNKGQRRFAAALATSHDSLGRDTIGNFSGMGLNTRVDSCDVYTRNLSSYIAPGNQMNSSWPTSRMCHTITQTGDAGSLLVGGRTSPDNSMADCWYYHKWLNTWERVQDLPKSRYRHSAVCLANDHILLAGGKCDSRTLVEDYIVWSRRRGWVSCQVKSKERPIAAFGSCFIVHPYKPQLLADSRRGIIAGGISCDGQVEEHVWEWTISDYSSEQPTLTFKLLATPRTKLLNGLTIARFGAQAVIHDSKIIVVGGIAKDILLPASNEIISTPTLNPDEIKWNNLRPLGTPCPRPLLIGASVAINKNQLVIMGGSAVCFSFGTFWNKGCYALSLDDAEHDENAVGEKERPAWGYATTLDGSSTLKVSGIPNSIVGSQKSIQVPRVKLSSSTEFDKILDARKPVILEGLDIGTCCKDWTSQYLKDKVGVDRDVIVHEASTEHMNFNSKNFAYVTKEFGDFLDEVESGGKLYLRSLSAEKSSEIPADIVKDFPTIAPDFQLPSELAVVMQNAHSAPLRISGPVNMWLHYDVMANVLCQIKGSKRLLLFPPSDVKYFDFAPGASSSGINVFEQLNTPSLSHTHPHEATLQPGDILFLPSLWLHTASPTSGISVAVNVFFRNLRNGYAAGKDVYGNRDLQAYEKGRQDVGKIVKSFEALPADVRGFYLQRLADELQSKAG